MTGNIIERDGWIASEWSSSNGPVSLPKLKGKVVVHNAFQMLCPGCVSHGTPKASRVAEIFDADKVAVIGLHTVTEVLEKLPSRIKHQGRRRATEAL